MRKYEHDTSYYGYDIVTAINKIVNQSPDLDRGGVYIWSVFQHSIVRPLIIYLNLNENNGRGTLECHRTGKFNSQFNCDGILKLNDDCTDCVFDKKKLIDYLEYNLYEDRVL